MSKPQVMHARDAISAKMAECYITIDGNRYNFMQVINVKAEIEKTKTEVAILGKTSKGNKSTGEAYSGSCTYHDNTSIFRELMHRYKETGEDVYFDMQITNEDPTSSVGRQTIILKDCNIDGGVLAHFDADEEILEAEFDFTYEDWYMPEKYRNLDGML